MSKKSLRDGVDPFEGVSIESLRLRGGEKWGTYGDEVIPAFVADLDVDPCPAVVDAIDDLVGRGALTYPGDRALSDLSEIFSNRMSDRFGWTPEPGHVRPLTDVDQGVALALAQLTASGDGVMVLTPTYPPFLADLTVQHRSLVAVPMTLAGTSWELDLDALAAAAAPEEVSALILVNPHNPTGHSFTATELAGVAEVCARHGVTVLADEIWAEIRWRPEPAHLPFAPVGEAAGVDVVTFTSATKSHNIAGLRCAVAHSSSRRVRDALDDVPSQILGRVSAPGLAATTAAWRGDGDDWLAGLVAGIGDRHAQLASFLADHLPELEWEPPDATYVAWIDARPLGLPLEPYDFFLDHARVALGEGAAFGPGGEGRMRINVGTGEAVLRELLERMVTAVDIERTPKPINARR